MATRNICLTLTLFLSLTVFSQSNRDEILGTWLVASGTHRVSNKISIPTIGILRYYEFLHHYELSFFRTGITYRFGPKVSATVGYGFLNSEPFIQSQEARGAFYQNWLYEQLTLKDSFGKLKLSHRYRLESRWIHTPEGTNLRNRVRYRVKGIYPLGQDYFISASNEIFISLQAPLFNQNRMHIGAGRVFTPSLKLEVGFMKNHFSTANYEYLFVEFSFKTDLRKKNRS
ncbi:MAG: DUF2490 domain-containing protein [Bacteroidota bacterium]